MRGSLSLILFVGVMVLSIGFAAGQSWPQWALNPQHTSQIQVVGQPLNRELSDVLFDPLVSQERAAEQGVLGVHYQVPLIDGSDVFMEFKSGTFNKNRYDTQVWGEN